MSDRRVEADDVLADVLSVTRLGETVVTNAELVPPWGLEIDPTAEVAVHVVQRGRCWLRTVQPHQAIEMSSGDLVLIRSGVAHSICDAPTTPPRPHREVLAAMPRRLAALTPARAADTTRVMCAKYLFQEHAGHPLLALLPPLVRLSARDVERHRQLQLVLQLVAQELLDAGTGSELVLPRLVDSLLVFVLRAWLDAQPIGADGWFGALRDPAIAKALSLMHRRPEVAWSVEQLAREVALSRAAFARRFAELVGETPVAYLTRWRMCIAAKLLSESEASLDQIALRVGYETSAAFSKAFRRSHGDSPGRYRSHRRESHALAG
jgi:AraC-like DNA-binding protein